MFYIKELFNHATLPLSMLFLIGCLPLIAVFVSQPLYNWLFDLFGWFMLWWIFLGPFITGLPLLVSVIMLMVKLSKNPQA